MFNRKKKIQHPDSSFYGYEYRQLPNAGAQEFAFQPSTTLPLFLFRGAGKTFNPSALRPLQPAPVEMRHKRTTIAGMGTFAGQYALQPLTTLDAISSGGEQ